MTETSDAIWRDIEGFKHPNCPECGRVATLSIDGYYCDQCSDFHKSNPAVDNIPNGAEFDQRLAEYKAAVRIGKL